MINVQSKEQKQIEQINNEENLKKKTIKALDLILIIVGISTFVFTIVMLIFFYLFQAIPDVLCERFFTVIVGELGITGVIKIVKIIFDNKNTTEIISENNDDEDNNYELNNNTDNNTDNEEEFSND